MKRKKININMYVHIHSLDRNGLEINLIHTPGDMSMTTAADVHALLGS